jgi:hypothetical protein
MKWLQPAQRHYRIGDTQISRVRPRGILCLRPDNTQRPLDCGPIDAEGAHSAAGFVTVQVASTDMWTLPVAVVVDVQTSRSAR